MESGVDWGLYPSVVLGSAAAGVAILWLVGGYYHVRYYVLRRGEPETWKCQPKRFPSAKMQRKAMRLATGNLVLAGLVSGHLVFAITQGLPTPIYFDVEDYGWPWTIGGTVVLFFLVDGAAYYVHRLLHRPALYRRFHHVHHKWGAPSPWVVTAVHPAEMLMLQAGTLLPLFVIPFHYVSAIAVFVYVLVFNIIDHSGVRLSSIWPWQASTSYHDDHHVHFHVNFGQHLMIFDRLHGTLRRTNRRYGKGVFGGKGAEVEGAEVDGDGPDDPGDFVRY